MIKTIHICGKTSDMCAVILEDDKGVVVFENEGDYVPSFFPGEHYGDYLVLDIDVATGVITNWKKPSQETIKQWIKGETK